MTTDAKVGLLLGLVFIVIIAFVINGLPDFVGKFKESTVVETAVTTQTGGNLVIEPAVVDVARSLQQGRSNMRYVETPTETVNLELSAGGSQATEAIATETAPDAPEPGFSNTVKAVENPSLVLPQVQRQETQSNPQLTQTQQAAQETVSHIEAAPSKTAAVQSPTLSGKTHLVSEGESLGSIAKKYYGTEAGNQRATIQKLYEANKSVLDSPNKINIGDKLIIPELPETQAQPAQAVKPKQAETKTLMDKFKDVFVDSDKKPEAAAKPNVPSEKPKTTDTEQKVTVKKPEITARKNVIEDKRAMAVSQTKTEEPKAAAAVNKKPAPAANFEEYTIQNGDSPYKLAEKLLGDGNRYPEILSLNKDRIKNPSKLVIGTKIKVPKR